MPRPPILPAVDWPAFFAGGKTFEQWLELCEPQNKRQLQERLETLELTTLQRAWLADLPKDVHVIVFAEDWCGDVIRHVPIVQKMEDAAGGRLKVRYYLREEAPEIFVRFLTNGGEAIPKCVFFSDQWVECGNWGPMTTACRRLIAMGKACGDVAAARKLVAASYDSDPVCREVFDELFDLIQIASCTHML